MGIGRVVGRLPPVVLRAPLHHPPCGPHLEANTRMARLPVWHVCLS